MDINPDVVPVTIEEAVQLLRDGLTEEDRVGIRMTKTSCEFHYTAGRWLRNNWTLWDERSHLRAAFRAIGLSHPDDISAYLVKQIWVEARGLVFDPAAFVAMRQEFWREAIGQPIP